MHKSTFDFVDRKHGGADMMKELAGEPGSFVISRLFKNGTPSREAW
jgi:hypothetical protein